MAQSILYGWKKDCFFACLPYSIFMLSINFLQSKEEKGSVLVCVPHHICGTWGRQRCNGMPHSVE